MSRYRVGAGSHWRTFRTGAEALAYADLLRERGVEMRIIKPHVSALATYRTMTDAELRRQRAAFLQDAQRAHDDAEEPALRFIVGRLKLISRVLRERAMQKKAAKRRARTSPPVSE